MGTRVMATLSELHDTGQTVADPDEDIRGRRVIDRDGFELGRVRDLLVDTEELKVRLMRVDHGGFLGFGVTSSFVPVDAIRHVDDEAVHLHQEGTVVAGAPRYDPDLVDTPDIAAMYSHYGYPMFWVPGFMPEPSDSTEPTAHESAGEDERT